MKKLRVMVDFYQHEQTALEELCQADYRLPDDQIRWLVTNEAKRRGLCRSIQATITPLPTGPAPEQI